MTLCLAAACQEDGDDRIVLCSDWKSGSSLGSSQTSDKLRWLKKKPNWIALTAGKEKAIESVVRRYRAELPSSGDIDDSNGETIFGKIAQKHLLQKKSDCVESEIGVTYRYFRTHLAEFPYKVQVSLFGKIARVDLEASLLIVGYTSGHRSRTPLICEVARDASIAIHPHFGVIGEGLLVATPPILRREFDCHWSLKKTIYQLYESKTLSEIVQSVGDNTSIDVFYPDGTLKSVNDRGYRYLDRALKEYGPKPKITRLKDFGARYLDPFPFSDLS